MKNTFTPIGEGKFKIEAPEFHLPYFFYEKTKKITKREATKEFPVGSTRQCYYDLQTNKYSFSPIIHPDAFQLTQYRNSTSVVVVEYVEHMDCLAIIVGDLRSTIAEPKYDDAPRFVQTSCYYITRNKEKYLSDFRYSGCWKNVDGSYHFVREANGDPSVVTKLTGHFSVSWLGKSTVCCTKNIEDICEKFFGFTVAPGKGNKLIKLDNIWSLVEFISHKTRVKKRGPKQLKIDELTKIELPDVDAGNSSNTVGFIHRANDEYCVVRLFSFGIETCRFYVSKKNVFACNRTDDGEWTYRPFTASGKGFDWNFCVEDIDADAVKGTQLEYLAEMLDEMIADNRGVAIWGLLTIPCLERLAKADERLKKVVFKALNSYHPYSSLTSILGDLNQSEKKLFKILGINKYQFELFAEKDFEGLPKLKQEFANTTLDLASFDNETTDLIVSTCDFYHEHNKGWGAQYCHRIEHMLATVAANYGLATMRAIKPLLFEMVGKTRSTMVRGYTSVTCLANLYGDYIDMAVQLHCSFPANIEVDRVAEAHDVAMEAYNAQKIAIEVEKWNALKPTWRKWTFDDKNEDYVVILPEKPQDLAVEGITLHHCVKSYIGKVSNGTTNIVFIRKREEIDEPFFTVEISNEGGVEQIHGFGNRNLGTEPELVPFVNKWIKAKKLKSCNFNKVR